jgi:hypothetical protein
VRGWTITSGPTIWERSEELSMAGGRTVKWGSKEKSRESGRRCIGGRSDPGGDMRMGKSSADNNGVQRRHTDVTAGCSCATLQLREQLCGQAVSRRDAARMQQLGPSEGD